MGAARKYPDELRERSVRLVLDQVRDQETSVTTACRTIGQELGINADTLRGWVKEAQVKQGLRPGTAQADAARIRALEKENAELRQAAQRPLVACSLGSPGRAMKTGEDLRSAVSRQGRQHGAGCRN